MEKSPANIIATVNLLLFRNSDQPVRVDCVFVYLRVPTFVFYAAAKNILRRRFV